MVICWVGCLMNGKVLVIVVDLEIVMLLEKFLVSEVDRLVFILLVEVLNLMLVLMLKFRFLVLVWLMFEVIVIEVVWV